MLRPSRAALCALSLVACVSATAPARAGGAISFDVRDVDIYDAVRLLSEQAALNVVVDGSVQHRPITLRLTDVSFDEALATLARASELQTARIGNIVYLGPADVVNRRYGEAAGGTETHVFHVRGADAGDVARALDTALPKGTLVVADHRTAAVVVTGSPASILRARRLITTLDGPANTVHATIPLRYLRATEALRALLATSLVVAPASAVAGDQQNELLLTGPADFIAQASDVVAKIDRPGRQVRYDVRVTDIAPSEDSNVGFLWGGAGATGATPGSISSTFLHNSYAVDVTLNALVTTNRARILARPSLSSLNDVPASLLVGEQYPIVYFDARTGTQQVQFVNIGVNLNVTPTIGADGAITTDLETDYSQVNGLNAQGFPIITTRKASSTLRVRSDQTIVVAGLFSDVDSTTLAKVPFLGDLPIVGEIFRNREHHHAKDEIVFLITPHLVPDDDRSAP